MINITLPNFNFDIPVVGEADPAGNDKSKTDKYYEILEPHLPWKKGGVYFLYNDDGPVYIGRSVNLNQRVTIHLLGNEKSTRQVASRIKSVKGFFVEDICDQEIYESYAIKIFKPPYNRAKTERIRRNYGAADKSQVQGC